MSRIRTVKPSFWEDEKIASLPMSCRLFYIGTWNQADDMGVVRANPALLKSTIFPYDEDLRVSEVKKWIDALVDARMLIPINYNNESYYIIRTFRSHQKFDARYPNFIIPQDITTKLLNGYNHPTSTRREHIESTTREREGEWEEGDNIPHNPPSGESEINFSFDQFWELYDKKIGKKETLIKKWLKLSDKERELAMSYIPKYQLSQPNKQYRKNPETFLNQKAWNDELIFSETNGKTKQRSPNYKQSDFD